MTPALTRTQYQALLRLARRHARIKDEAEDLLHDALIAAVAAGRLPWREGTAWFSGVLRQRAAMDARSALRRRRREADADAPPSLEMGGLPPPWPVIAALTPALRIVALLIMTGHNRAEIAHLLRLSDETLRQRVSALRRKLKSEGPAMEFTGLGDGLAFGALRQALLPATRASHLGSHDPDGHLFTVKIVRTGPHKNPGRGN
jgi:DNA-directed RNA polymerase specialized sigma24 family protein